MKREKEKYDGLFGLSVTSVMLSGHKTYQGAMGVWQVRVVVGYFGQEIQQVFIKTQARWGRDALGYGDLAPVQDHLPTVQIRACMRDPSPKGLQ